MCQHTCASTYGETQMTAAYTITPARYSKGNFIVQTHNEGPWKGRAERLIVDGLKCRYTGRERGFVASAAKVRKFEAVNRRLKGTPYRRAIGTPF